MRLATPITPTTQRYLVIHKPSLKEPSRYFGPFVSQTLAERFANELPDDKPGARTFLKPLLSSRNLGDH